MTTSPRPAIFDDRAKYALIAALVTLTFGGFGLRSMVSGLNVFLRKEPVDLRQTLGSIPRTLGDWTTEGEDELLDASMVESLGTDRYLNRAYRNSDGSVIRLHLAYYTGMVDAVPHIPDRCFVAGGWDQTSALDNHALPIDYDSRDGPTSEATGETYQVIEVPHPITGRRETVLLPFDDYEMRVARFTRSELRDAALFGGYFFIANHRMTPNPQTIRSLAFKPSERYAYYVKVQFSALCKADEPIDTFLDQSSDLLSELLPHLMRCLPDWTEVESRSSEEEQSPASPAA